jgi:TatD DNase family protein
MQLIDTHSHLYSSKFDADLDGVVERARQVLTHVFLPNVDLRSIDQMHNLVDRAPDFFYPMMGLHPCSVKEDYREVLATMEPLYAQRRYYGVGECGLDYYWDKTHVAAQKAALKIQIEWAKEMGLPLILHCRDSMEDVIALVEEGQDGRLFGIFHCFTGSVAQAARISDLGFVMGIGGVLTYKNGGLAEIVGDLPLEHLVLETDSPYLPPVPHRGQRNESSYTTFIARKLAEEKGLTYAEVARVTTANALRIFQLQPTQA